MLCANRGCLNARGIRTTHHDHLAEELTLEERCRERRIGRELQTYRVALIADVGKLQEHLSRWERQRVVAELIRHGTRVAVELHHIGGNQRLATLCVMHEAIDRVLALRLFLLLCLPAMWRGEHNQ